MFDATLYAASAAADRSQVLERYALSAKSYAVATVHRPANTDDAASLTAVMEWLAARALDHPVILPLHPRTRQGLTKFGLSPHGVHLIEPLGYLDMSRLLSQAIAIYTDYRGYSEGSVLLSGSLRDATPQHRMGGDHCCRLESALESTGLCATAPRHRRIRRRPRCRSNCRARQPARITNSRNRGSAARAPQDHMLSTRLLKCSRGICHRSRVEWSPIQLLQELAI